jgi:hypothetical protein
MCWSMGASVGMVALGSAATVWTLRRRDPPAVPAAVAWFTVMEGLQVAGYGVVDQCGSGANQAITLLSYLHITFQPLFINAFAMALIAGGVSAWMRTGVHLAGGASAAIMLLQLYPFDWAGTCRPGTALCAAALCTVSGDWHIAWDVPYNALVPAIELLPGTVWTFPSYMVAVFIVPLLYGAWRFALFHALAGPVLASLLTSNPNEIPAIWCLFSIGLVSMGVIPPLRRLIFGRPARPALA